MLSTAGDMIPMKIIKESRTVLEPQLLNMMNRIIETLTYPQILKVTKILPIPKPPKDANLIDGWRPINLVSSISKIAEKCILAQMLQHVRDNNVINYNHHGSMKHHSTQTHCPDSAVQTVPMSVLRQIYLTNHIADHCWSKYI